MLGIQRKYWNNFLSEICKTIFSLTSTTWSAAATSPKLQSKSLERISPVVKLYRLIFTHFRCYFLRQKLFSAGRCTLAKNFVKFRSLDPLDFENTLGPPLPPLLCSTKVEVCHEAGQSATADGVITPNFASQHQCKYSAGHLARPRWWCHLLQSWLVWGAPCLLCCPAAPSAPPSALSLEHPEWNVAKETRAKNKFAKKYYLPELVATTVEHSWSWPCGDTLNCIQYINGSLF